MSNVKLITQFSSIIHKREKYKILTSYIFLVAQEIQIHFLSLCVTLGTGCGLGSPGSNPGEARFSAPVQTGLGAHPASYTMGTGFSPG
jgi:hypothetical protein